MPKDNIPVDSPTGTPNTLHLHDPTPPTIVLADETPPFKPDEPNIVGGDPPIIDEAITSVRVLSSPEPMYPLVSRARDEAGTVFVKVMISPYGIASDAQVAKSSGYPRLDEAAIKAVKGWRFAPAKRGSQAIATWVTVPVKFVLNARG
jgi:protein TonB